MIILIGSASSYKAIVVAEYIKENYPEIFIIGIESKRKYKIFHSKYFDKIIIDINFLNEKHEECIKKIMINEAIEIYIPIDSSEFNRIFNNDILSNIKQLSFLGDIDSYHLLNSKDKLYELCIELGVQVPKSYYNKIDEIKIGTVVKPINLSSSKGVCYIKGNDDIERSIQEIKKYGNFIVQEYIAGNGVGYSVYAKKGEIIEGYGHKRLSEYPVSGGSSNYRTSFYHNDIRKIVEVIIKATKWTGFAMFEFKVTDDNSLYLIEVNPRIWGSINQGLQNGINYFSDIFGEIDNFKRKKEYNTYLSPILYISLIKYIYRFNFKPILEFLGNLDKNKVDVSLLRDPLGYLSMILRRL